MLLNCGVGEDSWESLWTAVRSNLSILNQSWIFTGRIDAEAEAPILWPPDANRFIGKDPNAGKDWRQEEKGMTEDQMVGWHHWLNRHEFEQTPGDREGQGSLVCCSLWGHKELDTTEQLNNNDNMLWTFNTRALYLCLLSRVTAIPLFSVNIISSYPFPHPSFSGLL